MGDEFDDFDALEEVVILKQYKMLAVTKMIGYDDYTADGAIGFGLEEEEQDDYSIEADTNFLTMMLQSVNDG